MSAESNQLRQINAGTSSGRYRPRTVDYSQYASGTSALKLTKPREPLSIYRIGQYLLVTIDGERESAKIIGFERDFTDKYFVLMIDGQRHKYTRAALDEATRPPQRDINVPLLPALSSASLGWWSHSPAEAIKVTPPRVIYAVSTTGAVA